MKVVHITPTYFDNASVIGGGERYPTELAFWMSKVIDTTLVSFASERRSYTINNLRVELYPVNYFIHGNKINPLSFRYLSSIYGADVVHIHNLNTLISDLGCLTASLLRKRIFVTDYGGGGDFVLNRKIPIFPRYHKAIAYSQLGLNLIHDDLQKKSVLIKGGLDVEKFCPSKNLNKENKFLYIGRILPHKGINYLIGALRLLNSRKYKLTILGRVYNEEFYQDLKQLAVGLPIEFVHDADDQRLLYEYHTSLVTILPSVHTSCYGTYTPVPELMGFTLMESQACGTPVICTDAGAMHEFVNEGYTGFVVKQNSEEEIAAALQKIINLSSSSYTNYQTQCRKWMEPFSWSTVVQQHLNVYS